MFFRKPTRLLAVVAAAIAIGGGAYGIVSATASSGSARHDSSHIRLGTLRATLARGGGSNARSGPAAGGASGTVASVSTSSFTLSTSAGQKVTVNKASSTTYQNGASSTSASAIRKGESVLVLGTVNGTTITASQVIVQPTSSGGSATSSAAAWSPSSAVHRPRPSRSVRSRRATARGRGRSSAERHANKATEAALGRLPGRHRRPRCEAEQRRVRGPQHRRQLAPPHLRQPELQGRRRRLAVARGRAGIRGSSQAWRLPSTLHRRETRMKRRPHQRMATDRVRQKR